MSEKPIIDVNELQNSYPENIEYAYGQVIKLSGNPKHNECQKNIQKICKEQILMKKKDCIVTNDTKGINFIFKGEQMSRRPDNAIYCKASKSPELLDLEKVFINDVPEVVFEVLSESTALVDRNQKPSNYCQAGVLEYIVVDYWAQSITLYDLSNDLPFKIGEFDKFGPNKDGLLPLKSIGISIPIADIFDYSQVF